MEVVVGGVKGGGINQKGMMYRHQLRDCSRLQQGHKSSQFPDNTLRIHECTEQADNTALPLLHHDVSISFLCLANLRPTVRFVFHSN